MNPIRICIIVPANTDQYNQAIKNAVSVVLPPDVTVDVTNISKGNNCIQNRVNLLQNGFPVVELARQIDAALDPATGLKKYQGIWLSDFDMCGVEATREVINIPIIGGFSACAYTALTLCRKFSIVTILQSTVEMQRDHIAAFNLTNSFASIHSIDVPVDELKNTKLVVEKTYQAAVKAITEEGAQSILLGCTGFTNVAADVSTMLEETLGLYIPVIDPNQAGISMLISLIRMNLRPSRVTYPQFC